MEKIIIMLKEFILSMNSAKKFTHYRKDLRELNMDEIITNEIVFSYHSEFFDDLLKNLGMKSVHLIKSNDACLLATDKKEPIGCLCFNLKGTANFVHPFKSEIVFKDSYVYGFGLFVKNEYRSIGIGKKLYLEAFKILKGRFDYFDVLVENGNFASEKLIQKLKFNKLGYIVLLKFFWFKSTIALDSKLKNKIYELLASSARTFSKLLKAIFKIFYFTIQRFKVDMFLRSYILSSIDIGVRFKIAFIGKDRPEVEILDKIFPYGYDVEKVTRFFKYDLAKLFNDISSSKDVDLIIVDGKIDSVHKNLSSVKDIKIIPKWVVQRNVSYNNLNDFKKTKSNNKNRTAHADIKKISASNYEYVFTKDFMLLSFFYKNMYLPYMYNRYKNSKLISSFGSIKKSFNQGGLMLIKNKDRYLSGSVIELKNNVFQPMKIGILNGDLNLLKESALVALYYSYFKFAEERKIKIINLGSSRAFLNDGVLRYKVKWNTTIEFDKKVSNILGLKICRLSEPVKSFLISNPFITIEGNSLVGNIFVDSHEMRDREEIIKGYPTEGLAELRIVPLGAGKSDGSMEALKIYDKERRNENFAHSR